MGLPPADFEAERLRVTKFPPAAKTLMYQARTACRSLREQAHQMWVFRNLRHKYGTVFNVRFPKSGRTLAASERFGKQESLALGLVGTVPSGAICRGLLYHFVRLLQARIISTKSYRTRNKQIVPKEQAIQC